MSGQPAQARAERVAALHRQAAADRATYQATRRQGGATGNLTRTRQTGGGR